MEIDEEKEALTWRMEIDEEKDALMAPIHTSQVKDIKAQNDDPLPVLSVHSIDSLPLFLTACQLHILLPCSPLIFSPIEQYQPLHFSCIPPSVVCMPPQSIPSPNAIRVKILLYAKALKESPTAVRFFSIAPRKRKSSEEAVDNGLGSTTPRQGGNLMKLDEGKSCAGGTEEKDPNYAGDSGEERLKAPSKNQQPMWMPKVCID